MRHVGVITGNRSDYGHLVPVIRGIRSSRTLRLRLFVTGMHLSEEFGRTADFIRRDGIQPAALLAKRTFNSTPEGMVHGIGRLVEQLVKPLRDEAVDVLLLLGDRGEMLAGAIAATYLRIPIAHLHGGERTGDVDEPVRHAISRLAHIHLPATKGSGERLKRTGEQPWRIHVVGSPRVDLILHRKRPPREKVLRAHGLDLTKPLILLIQHPTAKDRARAGALYRRTLSAIVPLGANIVAMYPNGDPGSLEIIRVLTASARRYPLTVYPSLPEDEFLDLLSASDVLVGNSSSGIIEAPSLKVPTINIGDRQQDRERGGNVIDVPHEAPIIRRSVRKALFDRTFRRKVAAARSPWGDGRATRRIVRILESVPFDEHLLDKHLTS
jgi:GDP/UDP-N,N'-diacetylbacillosamine 2-epimerase (hydrolysing)